MRERWVGCAVGRWNSAIERGVWVSPCEINTKRARRARTVRNGNIEWGGAWWWCINEGRLGVVSRLGGGT